MKSLISLTIVRYCRGQDPPEGQDGGDEENCLQGGGVRYRENLKKYVVEYRPSRFKWKLWMGTYPTQRDGQRAYDCAKYYAGQEKGKFYFADSPGLFAQLGPLTRPFSVVSRENKDKAFAHELKKRAKEVIKKENDSKSNKLQKPQSRAQTASPIAHPSSMLQDVEHMLRGNQTPTASHQIFDHLSTSSQEFGVLTPESVATADPCFQGSPAAEVVLVNELCKSSKEAVPVAREYVDPAFENLDTLEPLPEVHHHPCYYPFVHIEPEVIHHPHHPYHQPPYYVAAFDMVDSVSTHEYQTSTSSFLRWDYQTGDQDSDEDTSCLWNHDR